MQLQILPLSDNYPTPYKELTDYAKEEQNNSARPEIASTIDNITDYDTIYPGYPIWWGDLPMICYTFLESYDLSGKTILPFCTHGARATPSHRRRSGLPYRTPRSKRSSLFRGRQRRTAPTR